MLNYCHLNPNQESALNYVLVFCRDTYWQKRQRESCFLHQVGDVAQWKSICLAYARPEFEPQCTIGGKTVFRHQNIFVLLNIIMHPSIDSLQQIKSDAKEMFLFFSIFLLLKMDFFRQYILLTISLPLASQRYSPPLLPSWSTPFLSLIRIVRKQTGI